MNQSKPRGFTPLESEKKHSLMGFTLIELIIVISIIALLAAISTVSALRTRIKGNEGVAQTALKSIGTAAITFRNDTGAYPTDLAALGSSYIGGGLETGTSRGYNFSLVSGNGGETFTADANPKTPGFTGVKGFCIDSLNVIYIYPTNGITGNGTTCPGGGSVAQG